MRAAHGFDEVIYFVPFSAVDNLLNLFPDVRIFGPVVAVWFEKKDLACDFSQLRRFDALTGHQFEDTVSEPTRRRISDSDLALLLISLSLREWLLSLLTHSYSHNHIAEWLIPSIGPHRDVRKWRKQFRG